MERPPRLRVGKPRVTPRVWIEQKDERGSAHSRGYGAAWRRLREVVLQHEPLCRHCMHRGRLTPASEVDHITPLRDGGTNERDNLQPLCGSCHDDKTARDVRARASQAAQGTKGAEIVPFSGQKGHGHTSKSGVFRPKRAQWRA